jgi:hypothetical protein
MPRRLLIACALAGLLALTGCRGQSAEVTAQRVAYLVDLCNEIRDLDQDLSAVRDPAEREHLDRARQVRVWLYNNRWAALGSHEFEAAGLPAHIGSETPTRCGGMS